MNSCGKRLAGFPIDIPFGFSGAALIFFGLTVSMRWLIFGLLISVGALLVAGGALVLHVLRRKKEEAARKTHGTVPEKTLDNEPDDTANLE